ncbi:hypothetical protein AXG93_961s1260 [Marchantia polymorpha subsp. ruderalis]|uniref:Uncharacterized protein n=1 Tax=Marchantia polymorpha subsp. ruderalis TaxID=1480154 RepID=A0A176VRC6_MARPO|nr:hypothetical protein AXG93_961s1260 [Marchantia polymorpha subsp. ruderalis]
MTTGLPRPWATLLAGPHAATTPRMVAGHWEYEVLADDLFDGYSLKDYFFFRVVFFFYMRVLIVFISKLCIVQLGLG